MAADAKAAPSALAQAPNQEPIFVFGADLGGRHDQHSAAFAARVHGAEAGKASGASGNVYAIPYRNTARDVLPLNIIANYVAPFAQHARELPQRRFHIARFGCETGAHDDVSMARVFARLPDNCQLPGLWQRALQAKLPARLLLFDPSGCLIDARWRERLRRYLALNLPLWNAPAVELVSVGSARAIVANDGVAKSLGLKHRVFGTNDAYYGREAPSAAEMKAVWYATHFLAICDFSCTAAPQQIRLTGTATRGGLAIDQIDVDEEG